VLGAGPTAPAIAAELTIWFSTSKAVAVFIGDGHAPFLGRGRSSPSGIAVAVRLDAVMSAPKPAAEAQMRFVLGASRVLDAGAYRSAMVVFLVR
jgi:hypothetical protein